MKTVRSAVTVLIMLVLLGSLLSFPASAADITKTYTLTVGENVWITIDSPNGEFVDDYYRATGSLPPGISYGINADALVLHGTPTTEGTYTSSFLVTCDYETFEYEVTFKVKNAGGDVVVVTPDSPAPATDNDPPTITKSPTDETVDEGGSCSFIGGHKNAIWAVWHFVSPDGKTDYRYEKAVEEFKPVVIEGGDISHLKLKNIPYSLNGWRVYCEYSNYNSGTDPACRAHADSGTDHGADPGDDAYPGAVPGAGAHPVGQQCDLGRGNLRCGDCRRGLRYGAGTALRKEKIKTDRQRRSGRPSLFFRTVPRASRRHGRIPPVWGVTNAPGFAIIIFVYTVSSKLT